MLHEPRGVVRGTLPDAHQRLRCARPQRSRELHGRPIRDDRAEAAERARLPERAVREIPPRACRATVPSAMRCRGPWAGTTSSVGWTHRAIHRRSTPVRAAWPRSEPTPADMCREPPPAEPTRAPATRQTAPAASWRALVRTRRAGRAGTAEASSTRARSCRTPRPSNIDFTVLSAHYVSPLVINHEDGAVEQVPPTDIRARSYRGSAPVTAAIDWIKRRPSDVPWMASVSFAIGAHALAAATGVAAAGRIHGHQRPRLCQYRPAADSEQSDDRGAGYRARAPARRDRARDARPRRQASLRPQEDQHDGHPGWRQRVARIHGEASVRSHPCQGHGVPDRGMGTARGCRPPGEPAGQGRRPHDQYRRYLSAVWRDRRHRRARIAWCVPSIRSPCCRT